jgi:hypothetical protein
MPIARIRDVNSSSIGMVSLGYGKYVRADDIVALVPIPDEDRGDGRRTFVHTETLPGPLVASRSEKAILADMEKAMPAAGVLQRRRLFSRRARHEGGRPQAA